MVTIQNKNLIFNNEVTIKGFKAFVQSETADAGLLEIFRDSKSKQMTVNVGSATLNAEEGKKSQERKRELQKVS